MGVIHRLDKPVSGVMVYAKTQAAANALSEQVRSHQMEKIYHAVVCGKFVDNVGNYVDNLLKDGRTNCSKIVDKPVKDSRRAELSYRVLETVEVPGAAEVPETWNLVEIHLKTGRHHQIRVQFAGHGHPLWGDNKYNPMWGGDAAAAGGEASSVQTAVRRRGSLALCAVSLSFDHPVTGRRMTFAREVEGEGFSMFQHA